MTQTKKVGKTVQTLALTFILLGFPLVSWYYLKLGMNYQIKTRSELKDYGKLPIFNFTNTSGNLFNNDSLKKKMSVISFLGKNEKSDQEMLAIMQKLNEQFGDNSNLKLLIPTLRPQEDSVEKLQSLFQEYQFKQNQHQLLRGEKSAVQNWVTKGIKIPTQWVKKEEGADDIIFDKNQIEIEDYPFFVLVDTAQTIRNYYHIDNMNEVKRMIEHIAILLPKETKLGIEFQREREK